MESEDRVKQVNWLRETADDIIFYAGIGTPEEQVKYWLADLTLPSWFTEHDRKLLVYLVASRTGRIGLA